MLRHPDAVGGFGATAFADIIGRLRCCAAGFADGSRPRGRTVRRLSAAGKRTFGTSKHKHAQAQTSTDKQQNRQTGWPVCQPS